MDNIEFGPADVFEVGEVVYFWHPGSFRFVDDDMKPTGESTRLCRGCNVQILAERDRIEFDPTVKHSFPSITYIVAVGKDATSFRGPIEQGTLGIVGSPYLIRGDRDDGPHACNKAGWCI